MQIATIPLSSGAKNQGRPKRIIYHAMAEYISHAGREYHAVDFLELIGLSAHRFVCPSGVIIKGREDHQGAWHAKGFNTDSLGVEFLVPGIYVYSTFKKRIETPYLTDAAYQAGVDLGTHWLDRYQIIEHVDAHSELTPEKPDPGAGFPRDSFLADIGFSI